MNVARDSHIRCPALTVSNVRRWFLWAVVAGASAMGMWTFLAPWPPSSVDVVPWRPDAVVVLGGGGEGRARAAVEAARAYAPVPVVVTGDGGVLLARLRRAGVAEERLHHDTAAESTADNAVRTAPILDRLGADRVVLVTDWFHAPRARAVFTSLQPSREWAVAAAPPLDPLPAWDQYYVRRERLAALWYALRYGVWAF